MSDPFTHKCLQPLLLTAINCSSLSLAFSAGLIGCCRVMHDAAEQPRRRWLVHLAAVQACLVLAVVTLRRQPRPAAELLQHSLHPRELGYRTAKKRSGRAPGAALTTHLRGPLPTNAWWLDLARSDADDAAAAAYAVPYLFEKTGRGLRASPTRLRPRPIRC